MGTKATNLSLPAQPMVSMTPSHKACRMCIANCSAVAAARLLLVLPTQDCCICDSAPLIASGMVNGHIMMHRYSPYDLAAAAADREQDQPQDAASTSYTVSEVFSRPSKKGASCRAVCFTGAAEQQYVVAGFETGTLLQLDAGSGGKVLLRLTKAHNGAGINRLLAIQDQRNLVAAGEAHDGCVCTHSSTHVHQAVHCCLRGGARQMQAPHHRFIAKQSRVAAAAVAVAWVTSVAAGILASCLPVKGSCRATCCMLLPEQPRTPHNRRPQQAKVASMLVKHHIHPKVAHYNT